MNPKIDHLRQHLEALEPGIMTAQGHSHFGHGCFGLGVPEIDSVLQGGLGRGHLHEVYCAKSTDMAASACFAGALVQRMGQSNDPVVWVRQRSFEHESGRLYPPGLAALGLNPTRLIAVHVKASTDLLVAGLEAVRCASVAAVIVEVWGAPAVLDLTATRRFALAAEASGTTPLLLRVHPDVSPSASFTRWRVGMAPAPALAANAPGHPTFDLALLRNKAGLYGHSWRVEWRHDTGQFRHIQDKPTVASFNKPLSGGVVPLFGKRTVAAPKSRLARTG